MDALKHAAEQAQAGRGQMVAVMADPGVGKSRLFYEFKATSQSGWLVLEALSVSHGKASAYLPVLELLSQYFDISRDDDDRKRRERILGKVLGLDRTLEDALPYLYSLHGIADSDDSLKQMDPQTRRRRTLEAIKRIILRESLNQPLMVIFEDLHWIDTETQALLNVLVDAIANARILLLVNYRPEYRHEWGNRTHYTQLRLDPLARESADEMLSALVGDDKELTALKRLIVERTDGTPFFMEEMVQSLFEEGALQRNGTVRLAKPISTIKVPATVQAVLASRIDRLAPAAKELLQTLAVLGHQFTLTLVQRITLKSSDELEHMLAQLQFAEFISEQPAVGEVEYTFKHALTQEVSYNSILAERRKALHERADEAIEMFFTDRVEDYVTDLARHYERSGNLTKAVEYLGRAGRRAVERALYSEVTGFVIRALELVKQLPDDADRARNELELQITLSATLLGAVGSGAPEREKALTRAHELCERLGDSRMIEVVLSLGSLHWARSEPLLALSLCEKALALAEQTNDADALAAAHGGIGVQLMVLGQFAQAREHFERAAQLFSGRWTGGFGQALFFAQSAPSTVALTLLVLGYPITALRRAKDALEAARQRARPYMNAVALAMYVFCHLVLGDIRRVAEQIETLTAMTAEFEMRIPHTIATFCRSWLLVDGGRVNEPVEEMRRVITPLLGAFPLVDWLIVLLGGVYGRSGQADEGLATITEALTRSGKTPWLQAELHRLKGELTLLNDPQNEAEVERCFRQAIDIARCQAAQLFELRATTSLARLLAHQGRRGEARAILAEIYNWFTEGFELPDLEDAKTLLDELFT
jgi:tetratricopeptide (TPR) repeat protein